jgi:2-octaprenyl-6-methoxyphenol hydroxylase
MPTASVIVAGAGPAGLVAALVAAQSGFDVALVGPPTRAAGAGHREARTAALFPPSRRLLERLRVWPAVAPAAQAITGIRIVDAAGGLLRAPEILFNAADMGLDSLAHNVPIAALSAALEAQIARTPAIRRHPALTTAAEITADGATLVLADGTTIRGRLAIAADGQASPLRAAAAILAKRWAYQQTALVAAFDHGRPHRSISTEHHAEGGPCTTVPLPGDRSSLVWLDRPAIVQRLAALDDAAFREVLEAKLGGLLGRLGPIEGRATIAMHGLEAERLAGQRIVLVGETAHAFPPIGAQGLNLTLRDAGTLADLLAAAHASHSDPGAATLTAAYDQARRSDVRARVMGVDLLNRSLLTGLWPIALARGIGLHALKASAALKRQAMLAGMSPPGGLPMLMRE